MSENARIKAMPGVPRRVDCLVMPDRLTIGDDDSGGEQ